MKFKIIKGDLIEIANNRKADAIVHGCNCLKNFGKGLAKVIKDNFPKAYLSDLNNQNPTMGAVDVCTEYDTDIVNAYTQYYPGKSGYGRDTKEKRYQAIRSCMQIINLMYEGKTVALPLIGCGLAGLDWKVVKMILKDELRNCNVLIVKLGRNGKTTKSK